MVRIIEIAIAIEITITKEKSITIISEGVHTNTESANI